MHTLMFWQNAYLLSPLTRSH